MSVIQDALKKAQEERRKKNQEAPYPPLGATRKSKVFVYAIVLLLCVVVIIAYLYIPGFHRPKHINQPVVAAVSMPIKPLHMEAKLPPAPEAQQPTKETPEKKVEGVAIPIPQKPVEKQFTSVMPNRKQVPAGVETHIVQIQKIALSPSVERKTKTVESSSKQDITNESVGVVEKKADDGSVDRMYNEALREQQSGRTSEAKTIYKQVLMKQPNHTETLNNLGVIAVQEDNRAEALFYFRKILESQNNYPKAYNNIGLIAMRDGDDKLAEEYFRKAISLEPESVEPYLNLSALLRSQGRLEDASKLLETPLQKKVRDPALFLSYAVIKDRLGQHEDAARYYRQYLLSVKSPEMRKDILDRLKYIEKIGQ